MNRFSVPPSNVLPLRLRLAVLTLAVSGLAALTPGIACAESPADAEPAPIPAPITVSLPAYQSRLLILDQLVAKCRQKMIPANCDSTAVGADLQLALPGGNRLVRLNWLRGVLADAGKAEEMQKIAEKKKAEAAKAKPDPNADKDADDSSDEDDPDTHGGAGNGVTVQKVQFPLTSIEDRLDEAHQRLMNDFQWAASASDSNAKPAPDAAPEHQALAHILSAKEYKSTAVKPSLKDRLLEKIANWINQAIGKLVSAGSKSKWIGTAAEVGFGVVVCVVLVWFLIRLEKQGRFTASMIRSGPGSGAASARDWQLWLQDARDAAARQAWRDAIHLVYWASISRLEGSGLWPADRARTPREYLGLLSQESQYRPDLGALTRSFERTWYAGRAASESDFQAAEQLAARLGAKSGHGAAAR